MTFETFTTYVTTYYTGNITYIRQLIYEYSIEAAIWALIWAASAWLLSYLNNILAQRHRRKIAAFQEYETLNNQASNAEFLIEGLDKDISIDGLKKVLKEKEARQPRQSRLVRLLSYAVTVLKVMCVLSFAIIPSVLSSGDAISVAASIGINVGLFILIELYVIKSLCPAQVKTMINQNEYDSLKPTRFRLINEAYCAFKFSKILFLFITVLGILYIFSVPLMTMKACLAYYEPAHAAEFGPMHISTAFSRWLSLSQSCPSGQICHIYSTLPEDTSTSVILNVHTGIDVSTLTAAYNTYTDFQNTELLPLSSLAVSIKLDIESKGARYIHSMYLNNLTANTDYYVEFMYNNISMGKANFTTLPNSTMDKNLTMIVGGDSSGSELSLAFINQITNYDPDVILIGGDITYDNGDFDCFFCWDYYLDQFDQLNNRLGRLVPLIFAIGNHDIGQNDHQFLPVDPYANYFLLYFPQHSKPNNTDNTNTSSILPQVPLPEERLTYFYHTIGNMLFTTLDSGYIVENSGNQTTWLNNTSNQFKDYAKIAIYHVPIFPACEFEPEEYNLDSRLLTWIPVFESYNYLTVFENHVHLYKRTFPLKFGASDGPGVVYVGDGAWGINLESCYDDDSDRNITGYFERMGKINHIWILNATTETLSYEAIDVGGNEIDAYSQNIADYDL